jgi:hypothetical protein
MTNPHLTNEPGQPPSPAGVSAGQQPLVLQEKFAAASNTVLLWYDDQDRCWMLDAYIGEGEATEQVGPSAPAFAPEDDRRAQRWASSLLTSDNKAGFPYADKPSSWTITEWRLVSVEGRIGWMPLFDITDVGELPFPALTPDTGARTSRAVDNQLRVGRDRGASPMHPLGTALERGTVADVDEIAFRLALRLAELRQAAWLVPDPHDRLPVLQAYLRIHVEHAITSGHGHVDILREYDSDPRYREQDKIITAVAVWLYHDQPHPPIPRYQRRLRAACHRHADRFAQLDTVLANQRDYRTHHQLAAMTVTDQRCRQHLGSMLLRSHLALTDAGGIPTTATSTATGRRFFHHHGYAAGTSAPIAASPARIPGVRIWPCHRPVPAGALR